MSEGGGLFFSVVWRMFRIERNRSHGLRTSEEEGEEGEEEEEVFSCYSRNTRAAAAVSGRDKDGADRENNKPCCERERKRLVPSFPFHPPHTHNNFSFLFSFFSFSSFSSFSSFKIYFNGRTSFPCISLTGDLLPGYTNLLLLLLLLFLILIALFEQFVVFSSSSCLLLQ